MLRQLTGHIYYIHADHRTDRPVLAAIVGSDRVLMIDAGASPAHAQLFLDELERKTQRRPDCVVLTHWHWDHSFGMAHLAVPSIGQHNLTKNLSKLQGLEWDDLALAERVQRGEEIVFCAENIAREYGADRDIEIVLPTITFEQSMILDLGDVTCELHHLPTDHTDDAIAIYVREDRALFLGDALGQALYALTPYYSAQTRGELGATSNRFPAKWFIESHGEPADAEGFWAENYTLAVIAELIRSGTTQRDTLIEAVKQQLAGALPDDYKEVVDLFLSHGATPPLIDKVDCIRLRVEDLDAGLCFYRDRLGLSLIWRTEEGAGLRLPQDETEIVLHSEERTEPEIDLKVERADRAAKQFEQAGGKIIVPPFDIQIGRCAVVEDPWGNRLVLLDSTKGLLVTDDEGRVIGNETLRDGHSQITLVLQGGT